MAKRQTKKTDMTSVQDPVGGTADETLPLKGQESVYKVKATVCSRWQAPVQSCLRPAMWIPGLNRLHSHREIWTSTRGSTADEILHSVERALLKVIETDRSHSDFIITKAESDFLQIHVLTRVEWLDVIEMRFQDNTVKISAFSSGFLPLCLPGACLLNVVFFWVPFLDMGMNKKRLKWILTHMDVAMETSSP
ncbi:uncharacterized protein LOC143288646 [Babylonia areolata]|uniref:uncharacterized protein LOC143288646 n=1 Tax=Babylonia areolata TaxID=304850 RepID=UPI003FD530C0